MGRTKGSKNKKTLEREGKLQSEELKVNEKAEEKKAVKEWNKATTAINDLVERASAKGALISDTGPINYPK